MVIEIDITPKLNKEVLEFCRLNNHVVSEFYRQSLLIGIDTARYGSLNSSNLPLKTDSTNFQNNGGEIVETTPKSPHIENETPISENIEELKDRIEYLTSIIENLNSELDLCKDTVNKLSTKEEESPKIGIYLDSTNLNQIFKQ